ncbi:MULTISPECIES: hypothetical protein [Ruminococcus]|uniref:Uncharacterized protein n=1 Tax=Ruminococcus intestinalis TaxID=2763066 RepID=A0ABR7HLR6_9FIRM|nr:MULTISPECIES: hypothetical protein [Ruminococcus]MBC5728481.1 hypothetical protein [Ruminococcus intestinalis]MBS5691142.1 hypothetical protein [Eubacterium sp.]
MISIKCRDKLLFSGINWKSNYKSLVNLFKGCGCGQRPQILSVYCNLTIAKQQAVWRLNTTANAFKCESKKKRHSLYNEKS